MIMKQEDRQLVLVDLCARLPYGVKIKCNDDTEPYTLLSINWNKEIVLIGFEIDGIYATSKQKLADIKPYLRPMDSMTEEEIDEFTQFEIYADGEYIIPNYRAIDWLNKNMFDFRGLIPKGLAIKVTENNNPYKD